MKDEQHQPDRLLTSPEVADRLQVAEATLRRWAAEGRIARIRLGAGVVRYRREDVDAFVAACEQPASTA